METVRRKFTLIELLVVVGILAILMSILFPALRRSKEMANSIACKSNLRQMCVAIVMYAQDSSGWTPYPADYTKPFGAQNYYELLNSFKLVPNFVDSRYGPYCCPSGQIPKNSRQIYGLRCHTQNPVKGFLITGGMISITESSGTSTWSPSSFIIIGDSRYGTLPIQWESIDDNNYGGGRPLPCMRHLATGNFGFTDGHVAGISGTDLIQGYFSSDISKYRFTNYMDKDGNVFGYY